MTESIRSIFKKNIKILNYTSKTILYIRNQNFNKALKYSAQVLDIIINYLDDLFSNRSYFNELIILVDNNYINRILVQLLEAQENLDYILLADLYEIQLNAYIINLQEVIMKKEDFDYQEDVYRMNLTLMYNNDIKLAEQLKMLPLPNKQLEVKYSVECTSCGLMTLAINENNKRYYMHSNVNIQLESLLLAREWFNDNISEYSIYGLGFAYHIIELLELDDTIKINIYESDLKIIQLACAFTDINILLTDERVKIIYDPTFIKCNEAINKLNDQSTFLVHYPSLRNISILSVKEKLEDYFISYSSINNQLHCLNNNFRKNIMHNNEYVDRIKEKFEGKDIYIIAAGPSLDLNYKLLKDVGNNSVILSTGTVLRKLLNEGVNPDYVIIIDGNEAVYKQIMGIEMCQIPLLYLSTVYYKIPEMYKGKKYLICQKGYAKAEAFAKKEGYRLYNTGGSVSTTALDLGIQFGCKRIIFLGLDLAYSNNRDHAFEMEQVNKVDAINLRQVEDINGNMVGTTINLDIYRKWIEQRIKGVKGVEFIDATEGGAKIKGMQISKLKDIIYEKK